MEHDLQIAVANFLNAQERLYKSFTWIHPANGMRTNKYQAAVHKGYGMRAGAPDCILFTGKGRTLSIELKFKKGRISPEQKTFHSKLSSLEHPIYVVRSEYPHDAVNQVEKILRKEGVLT